MTNSIYLLIKLDMLFYEDDIFYLAILNRNFKQHILY